MALEVIAAGKYPASSHIGDIAEGVAAARLGVDRNTIRRWMEK